MTDWSNLSLSSKERKNLETVLDASRTDYQQTMQGVSDYVDTLVGDLFDFDHPDKSLALTDPDVIIDAARNLVEVAQTAADNRYGVQRQAWQQAAGKEFPEYALPDREDWTRVMWDVQKGFSNTDYNGLTYRQVMAGKARSGVTIMDLLPKTAGMSIDDMQQAYADFFRSMAVHAAQRRQMANIANDPTRPRWARVPRGSVTCAFCTMLAGRGFVYTSEEAAGGGLGNRYHNHCDCEPVPSWGEAKLSGYDPEKLDALYKEALRGLPHGASYREILARMRAQGGVADSPAMQGGIIDAAKAREHRAMCRETLERNGFLSRDAYARAVENGEARSYDEWASAMVDGESAWRDPQWLAGGEAHDVEYVSEAAKAEKYRDGVIAEDHVRELDTAERLKVNGVRCVFQIDHEYVVGDDGKPVDKGLADLADGTELKSLNGCSSRNTVAGYMKNTSKKRDAVRVVLDNSQNRDMSDAELAGYIRRSPAFKRGTVYIIDVDGMLVRIR